MLVRFCIYKPETITIERIKQIWRIRDYFDIPTLLLNELDLVKKIKSENMLTFRGIQEQFEFALRYNWTNLRNACMDVLKLKTAGLGGVGDSMRDPEIMNLLDMLVVAERRKSGIGVIEDGNGPLEGVKWSSDGPSPEENTDETRMHEDEEEDDEDDEIVVTGEGEGDGDGDMDETTMDLVIL